MKREWVTRRVRAYNVKPGDVVRCFDAKRFREVLLTVHWVKDTDSDTVDIGFRRKTFGWRLKRLSYVRVRRREAASA